MEIISSIISVVIGGVLIGVTGYINELRKNPDEKFNAEKFGTTIVVCGIVNYLLVVVGLSSDIILSLAGVLQSTGLGYIGNIIANMIKDKINKGY
ncbi:MAG: hypothetical protein ACOYWZ_00030 [Bacillota bacterium]